MSSYETKLAELQKLRDARKAERRARDEKDLEEMGDLLLDEQNILVAFPDASPDLPGHVLVHRPSGPVYEHFKSTMWKDSAQRGAIEAKANAGAKLALQCLKWPSVDRYKALCDAFPGVPDKVAEFLIEAGQAAARDLGKA